MDKNTITLDDNIYVKRKKPTKDELWAELFSLLDERIQNMPEEEYQEWKKSKRIF